MNTQAAVTAALLLLAGPLVAVADQIAFPNDAIDPQDPRLAGFYAGQCDQWATTQGLKGIERQNYIDGCRANGPAIWPVGTEQSSGGGE